MQRWSALGAIDWHAYANNYRAQDCAAILLYDPVNIRYALDLSNMQVWTAHNAIRYALIFADGPAIMFEFSGCHHLCEGYEGVDEVRNAISWIYMTAGDRAGERVNLWSAEIDDLMKTHGGGNRRLAIDKIEPIGLKALEALGLEFVEGQQLTERARAIKSADELTLMRWTIRVCEAGMARIYEHSKPGRTEQELWSELHFENARSGGRVAGNPPPDLWLPEPIPGIRNVLTMSASAVS